MEKRTSDLSSKLAEFTVGFDLDSVPAKALENAKVAILDSLGCCDFGNQTGDRNDST